MARPKRDPLIAAMIAKLPESGPWPVEDQAAWLRLMAMSFGPAYGGDVVGLMLHESIAPAGLAGRSFTGDSTDRTIAAMPPNMRAAHAKPKPSDLYRFYIDEKGVVRNAAGKQVKASEVKGELFDLRGMDGDMRSIQWADGSTGLNGADLTIVAV